MGNDGSQHFFFDISDNHEGGPSTTPSSLAFFWFPNAKPRNPTVSSPSIYNLLHGKGFQTAVGSMNHVAFNVDKRDIEGYRKRIKKSKMSPYTCHQYSTMPITPLPDMFPTQTTIAFRGARFISLVQTGNI